MLVLLSPAKKLDMITPPPLSLTSEADFLEQSNQLIDTLNTLSVKETQKLMGISDALIELNRARYQNWSRPFTLQNAKQAIFSFKGDVYVGLDAATLDLTQLKSAQKTLRILSGLYGMLRPLDLMQAYRLEMGTALPIASHHNLYEFWTSIITNTIQQEFKNKPIINLASEEYFKVINTKILKNKIIQPVFKDLKNGHYKIISFYAKKARGLMARFIIDQKIDSPDQLTQFNRAGYQYNEMLSKPNQPVFTREA